MTDHVHYATEPFDGEQQFSPGWHFWDETLANRFGPFPSEDAARIMQAWYYTTFLQFDPLAWELDERFGDHDS